MSYRKIDVNGKTYQYVVGRSHVKIQGPNFSKTFRKSEVGQQIGEDQYVVTPANIRNVVLGRPGAKVFACAEHGVLTSRLDFDPYALEIHGKRHLVMDCDRCLDQSAWDI
nr:hypothetical protein [Neorhizobium tomejilense]